MAHEDKRKASENQAILLLPVTLTKQLLLVKPLQEWELPASRITADESREKAAKRVLQNTTGYAASTVRYLGSIDVANTSHHLYMAMKIGTDTKDKGREDGTVKVQAFFMTEIFEMIKNDEITHGLTLAGLMKLLVEHGGIALEF